MWRASINIGSSQAVTLSTEEGLSILFLACIYVYLIRLDKASRDIQMWSWVKHPCPESRNCIKVSRHLAQGNLTVWDRKLLRVPSKRPEFSAFPSYLRSEAMNCVEDVVHILLEIKGQRFCEYHEKHRQWGVLHHKLCESYCFGGWVFHCISWQKGTLETNMLMIRSCKCHRFYYICDWYKSPIIAGIWGLGLKSCKGQYEQWSNAPWDHFLKGKLKGNASRHRIV